MEHDIQLVIDTKLAEYISHSASTEQQMELSQWVTILINEHWKNRFEILSYIDDKCPH